MDDLASTVLTQLRRRDGHGEISLLQISPYFDHSLLITPVTIDGHVTFDARLGRKLQSLYADPVDALNFNSATDVTRFAFETAGKTEGVRLRFVPSDDIHDGISHCRVTNEGDYVKVLKCLVGMRKAQSLTNASPLSKLSE